MSDETNETIADIVSEMRHDIADGTVGIWSDFCGEIARCFADRIETAYNRELVAKDEEIEKLRAALKTCAALEVVKYALGESRIAICHICNIKHTCGHGTAKFDPCCIIKDIDSAIAAIRGVEGVK